MAAQHLENPEVLKHLDKAITALIQHLGSEKTEEFVINLPNMVSQDEVTKLIGAAKTQVEAVLGTASSSIEHLNQFFKRIEKASDSSLLFFQILALGIPALITLESVNNAVTEMATADDVPLARKSLRAISHNKWGLFLPFIWSSAFFFSLHRFRR